MTYFGQIAVFREAGVQRATSSTPAAVYQHIARQPLHCKFTRQFIRLQQLFGSLRARYKEHWD